MKKNRKPAKEQEGPSGTVKLLAGGNPQIPKGDGDAPVQAYIEAMPGWKQAFGRQLDDLISREVPGVCKAVRWNSPFYRRESGGWFLSVHVLTRAVRVTFFDGLSLVPIPPGGTPKSGQARWVDLHEGETFDEAQWKAWISQTETLPGWSVSFS